MQSRLFIGLALGLLALGSLSAATPCRANCQINESWTYDCVGEESTCPRIWFSVSPGSCSYTVVLQRKNAFGVWVTVDSNYTSGETYCNSFCEPPCGTNELRLVMDCGPCGGTDTLTLGVVTCPQ